MAIRYTLELLGCLYLHGLGTRIVWCNTDDVYCHRRVSIRFLRFILCLTSTTSYVCLTSSVLGRESFNPFFSNQPINDILSSPFGNDTRRRSTVN